MKNYRGSAEGLKILFKAVIWMVICAFVSAMPLVGILGSIGMVVCSVMFLVGFYRAGEDIPACKAAFVLQIISTVVSVLSIFISALEGISLFTDLLPIIANLILLISVTKVVKDRGATSVARLGVITTCFYIGSTVGSVILVLVFVVLAFGGINSALVPLIVLIALVIASLVLYLKFLWNSAEQLGASV